MAGQCVEAYQSPRDQMTRVELKIVHEEHQINILPAIIIIIITIPLLKHMILNIIDLNISFQIEPSAYALYANKYNIRFTPLPIITIMYMITNVKAS